MENMEYMDKLEEIEEQIQMSLFNDYENEQKIDIVIKEIEELKYMIGLLYREVVEDE